MAIAFFLTFVKLEIKMKCIEFLHCNDELKLYLNSSSIIKINEENFRYVRQSSHCSYYSVENKTNLSYYFYYLGLSSYLDNYEAN